MWDYLYNNGATTEELGWFIKHPAIIDILGLDYYSHSELAWSIRGRENNHPMVGFKATALEYVEHYREYNFPLMLAETNLRGTITDRVSWLKYMVGECEQLQRILATFNIEFLGFCWYPYIDSTDWCHLVASKHVCSDENCSNRDHIDPQGLVSLNLDRSRKTTLLSETYRDLARDSIDSRNIPAYEFSSDVLEARGVKNFLPLLSQWKWVTAC